MTWYRPRSNKFGAKRTEYNGRMYDSKAEAQLAAQLHMLKRGGAIISIEPQKTFPLYGLHGNEVCRHRVDFLITWKDGTVEVQERKGFQTADWKIKHRLFCDNYPNIKYTVISN